jgi:hypothetical protein
MRRRKHQVFVAVFGVVIESDIFSSLIELEFCGDGKALWEACFTGTLVRQLARLKHGDGVNAGGFRESSIQGERSDARLLTGVVRQLEQVLFGLEFVIAKWDVRCFGGDGFHRGLASLSGISGTFRRRRHQADGRMDSHDSRAQQEGKQ